MELHPKAIAACGAEVLLGLSVYFVAVNSTLFLNSRIDHLTEGDLPRITIEDEKTVYCRMKADDFRFPLPPLGVANEPTVTSGGFDTVNGTLIVMFPQNHSMSPQEYEAWLRGNLQDGGWVSSEAHEESGGLLVSFSYFGDK